VRQLGQLTELAVLGADNFVPHPLQLMISILAPPPPLSAEVFPPPGLAVPQALHSLADESFSNVHIEQDHGPFFVGICLIVGVLGVIAGGGRG